MSASTTEPRREMEEQQRGEESFGHERQRGGNNPVDVDLHGDENEKRKPSGPRRRGLLGGLFRRIESDERTRKEAGVQADDERGTFVDSLLVAPKFREEDVGKQIKSTPPDETTNSSEVLSDRRLHQDEEHRVQKRQLDQRRGEQQELPQPQPPPPPPPTSQQRHSNLPRHQEVDTRPSLADYTRKISSMYFATAEDQIDGFESDEEDISTSEDDNAASGRVRPDDGTSKIESQTNAPQSVGVDVALLRDLVREELRKIVSSNSSNQSETTKQPMEHDFPELDAGFESNDDNFGNEYDGFEYEYETYDDTDYRDSNSNNDHDRDRIESQVQERVRIEVAQKEAELQAKYLADKEKEIERIRAEEGERMAKKIEADRAEAEKAAREKAAKAERIKQKQITAKRLKKERAKFERALAAKDRELEERFAKRKAKGTFLTRYTPEQITEMSEEEVDRIIAQRDE